MNTNKIEEGWARAGIFDKVDRFKYVNMDNFIYQGNTLTHYTNLSGLQGIIESNGFWLSDHRFLNDSEEYNNGRKLVQSILQDLLMENKYKEFKSILKNIFHLLNNEDESPFYICSFSSKEDCLNQWKGYANFDDAVAIIFKNDTKKLHGYYFNQIPIFTTSKVIYDDKKKKKILLGIIDHFFKEFQIDLEQKREVNDSIWSEVLFKELTYEFINFKNKEFESENEIRMVVHSLDYGIDDNPMLSLKYNTTIFELEHRVSNNRIVPYININSMYEDKKNLPIQKVIIGPTASLDITYKSVKTYLKNMGYSDVIVEKSNIPYRG